jgi:hypothetical protein
LMTTSSDLGFGMIDVARRNTRILGIVIIVQLSR